MSAKLKDALAAQAHKFAREELDIELDYSEESIKQVEKVLGALHNMYKKKQSQKAVQTAAIEFTAYIIKVIEKNVCKGKWRKDHPLYGVDSYTFQFKDTIIVPYDWCFKRIVNGPQDNVWHKYQVAIAISG